MAYATRADIEAVYGLTLLPGIADYDNDGAVDNAVGDCQDFCVRAGLVMRF